MLFDATSGLPLFTAHGFDVQPPELPPVSVQEMPAAPSTVHTNLHFQLSLASFNVGSLFTTPEGYGGKFSYLRQQMNMHSLNILRI